jgi:hypothetical protein
MGQRAFDDDIRRYLYVLTTLAQHLVPVRCRNLSGNRPGNDLADFSDVLFEVDVAFFSNQSWIRGDAVGKAERCCLANLIQIRGIEKELH